jgi:ABC-type polar amino acid transport system ATPase subunit
VLKGVDLEVTKGEVVVILGPSGSGKSTMLRCINKLEQPTGGKIFLEDIEITDPKTNINKVREQIGMVFQSFNLFPHLTTKGNVMLAQRKVLKAARPTPSESPRSSSSASAWATRWTTSRPSSRVVSSSASRSRARSPWTHT